MKESRAFLRRYRKEGNDFLDRIITTDETWMWFYDPEMKGQSMVWNGSGSPPPEKAGVTKSGGKHVYYVLRQAGYDSTACGSKGYYCLCRVLF